MTIFSVLTVLFIALKLTHYIDWSWWWITSPLWGSLIAFFLYFIGSVIYIARWGTPTQRAALKIKGLLK